MNSINQLISLALLLLTSLPLRSYGSTSNQEPDQINESHVSEEQIKDANMMIEESSNHTKQGLLRLFDKIDSDHDLSIIKTELIHWIIQYNEELLLNEANIDLQRFDVNGDNALSLEEFMKGQYGNISMDKIENNSDHNDIIEFIKDDKFRFSIADADKNEKLTINELKAFLRPHNHVEMLDYEVHRALIEYDKNKDKLINREEFIATQYGSQRLNVNQKTYVNKVFDSYDKNNDEQLSTEEIKAWLKPDIQEFARTESQYLINVSDKNGDQKLSKEEVIDNLGHWVSSKATNFGAHLADEL